MHTKTIIEKIKHLQPGEAIHIGHSYLVINVAGIKIVLDPSTETGYCTAPFCNLLPRSKSKIDFLTPLVAIDEVIPKSEEFAPYIDFVLYSHLHSDHFVASILKNITDENPRVQVIWPYGSAAVISGRHQKPYPIFMGLISMLHRRKIFNGYVNGIFEYLTTNIVFDIDGLKHIELSNGSRYMLREDPFIEIRAFEVRHPKPQLYFKLPFERSNLPQILGYEIVYDESGEQKKLLLIGETGTDPELLWKIWNDRNELVGVFIPVADEATTKGLKLIKDIYIHASLQIIALVERLSGNKTTIHCLHQGLWYYTLDDERVNTARNMLGNCQDVISEADIELELTRCRKSRNNYIFGTRHLLKLIKAIGCFNDTSQDKVRLNSPGVVFTYGQKEYS